MSMTIEQARALMHEWTASGALRVHMECVAACMGAYASKLEPGETDRWIVAGLLHDFDYEKHPDASEHPTVGVAHLESLGVDEEIRTAILGHAPYTGVARESAMAKTLFAVDELSGFIVACAKVRPEGVETLQAKSVRKKLKDKSFAAAVSREDIAEGIEDMRGLVKPADDEAFASEHIQFCIDAIRAKRERLGV